MPRTMLARKGRDKPLDAAAAAAPPDSPPDARVVPMPTSEWMSPSSGTESPDWHDLAISTHLPGPRPPGHE